MEIATLGLAIVLSALAGAVATRLYSLKQLNAKQKVLNDCIITLNRAIKLNDQMLYMMDGKPFEEAALAAELDEIFRQNP
jgi:hypothetical protein